MWEPGKVGDRGGGGRGTKEGRKPEMAANGNRIGAKKRSPLALLRKGWEPEVKGTRGRRFRPLVLSTI